MEKRLEELARRLEDTRKRTNKLSLEFVLASARILAEAKRLAGRGFLRWVRDQAHMDYETARRHLKVAEFLRQNPSLTSTFSTLSIAKIYKLSSLGSDIAGKLLTGKVKLSRPLPRMTDIQFREECRSRFPAKPRKATREHVFRATFSALVRAERSLHRALHFARKMTPAQRRRIFEKVTAISSLLSKWRVSA